MRNLSFVLWILCWPLVCNYLGPTISVNPAFKGIESTVLSVLNFLLFIIPWAIVGGLLYQKKD